MSKRVVPFFGSYKKNSDEDYNDRYYMMPSMQIRDSNVFSSGLGNNPWFNQRGQKLFNIGKPSVMKKVATDFRDLFSQMTVMAKVNQQVYKLYKHI